MLMIIYSYVPELIIFELFEFTQSWLPLCDWTQQKRIINNVLKEDILV